MADDASTRDVTPPEQRAPSGDLTLSGVASVVQTTTWSGTTVTSTTTGGVDVTVDYTSAGDRDRDGIADYQIDAGIGVRTGQTTTLDASVEASADIGRNAQAFVRAQASVPLDGSAPVDASVVAGVNIPLGAPSTRTRPTGIRPGSVEMFQADQQLHRELADVYVDPRSVRDGLDGSDTFLRTANGLLAPTAALTPDGASRAEQIETVEAYATLRQTQIAQTVQGLEATTPGTADAFGALVDRQSDVVVGFIGAYGADRWLEPYVAFRDAAATSGLEAAKEALPPGRTPGTEAQLDRAIDALGDASAAVHPDPETRAGLTRDSQEIAEIGTFRNAVVLNQTAAPATTPEPESTTPEAPVQTESRGPER
ncbi:MAG: hypothetical protein AAF594_02775 [Bacteroidota bacterium]